MSSAAQNTTVNGINVAELFQTIDQIKQQPFIARFRFRVDNEWIDGGHNRTTVKDFHGAGQEIAHEQKFQLDCDEPRILLGRDRGANPVEHLLNALAGCVTSSLVYHAAAKGIRVEEVESRIEGSIDLRGFLGIDKSIRNGFQNIQMHFKVKSDVPDEQFQQLIQLGPTYSPVFDSITRGVPVKVTGERV
jgi:uncharacterized OsmC-like protein